MSAGVRRRRKGRVVVLHLAAQYPFAGVIWQLLHHLVGLRSLGLEVYYLEDHGSWVYDPRSEVIVADPAPNLRILSEALGRFGFDGRWGFYDGEARRYLGFSRERAHELLAEADAVINLCGATDPREEHRRSRCMIYLQTDPGTIQVEIAQRTPHGQEVASAHHLFFTYAENLGAPDCLLPTGGIRWYPTRPPVLLDQWHPGVGSDSPIAFTTVGTWRNRGNDVEIGGETYYWSKHLNFRKLLEVAGQAGQPIELATDLSAGPDYEAAVAGGFSFTPVVPMSLELDTYREYISASRGEFTPAKDVYVRTRSGWFSDRTACYLAAGRPVITQRTGFEKYLPEGSGLLGFDHADEAVAALRAVNSDYARHCQSAREIAAEYFDAGRLLDEIAEKAGL
ncbi:MAG TPA: glycosyltransferase [Candidatus Binataceae bacterium]|nr:glycosyltransferase [Candidatus Binataceae bacterium]